MCRHAGKKVCIIHSPTHHSFIRHSFIHLSFIHSRNRDHLRARHCALQWKQNDDKTVILGQPTSLGQMGTHWEAPRSGAPGALQGQCARSRRAPRGCVRWGRASWHGGDRGGRGCRPVTEQSLLQEPRAGRDGEGGGRVAPEGAWVTTIEGPPCGAHPRQCPTECKTTGVRCNTPAGGGPVCPSHRSPRIPSSLTPGLAFREAFCKL